MAIAYVTDRVDRSRSVNVYRDDGTCQYIRQYDGVETSEEINR